MNIKSIKAKEWKEKIELGKEYKLSDKNEEEKLDMILVKLGYSMMLSEQDYERLEELYKKIERM